ncbi:MAG: hypothetical protein ACI85O_002567 [Saprospiraceae bacterium]|jgi:hypothetical protein
MANLMELLQGQMTPQMIAQLAKSIGGADQEQTAMAADGILSTLTSALAKNASTEQGVQSLSNALDRDHDGGILENFMDLIGGNTQAAPQQQRAMNGAGIMKHLLGNNQGGALDMISQMSGLNSNQSGGLMQMLAPMVLGMLGKQKKSQGLDLAGIASMLSGTVSQQKQTNPTMNLIAGFLDKDGDGNMMDDVAGMGMKMLGNFFKNR